MPEIRWFQVARKEQEGSYEDSKAKARHEKIAKEKKESVDSVKLEADHKRKIAICREEKRKEEIKELPRSERSAAKAELKEEIRKRKQAEKEAKRLEKEKAVADKKAKHSKKDENIDDKEIVADSVGEHPVENESTDAENPVSDGQSDVTESSDDVKESTKQ